MTQSFSLIYVLPDTILRWIGGPGSQSMSAQAANEIKGFVGSFGTGGREMASAGVNTAQKGASKADDSKVQGNTDDDSSGGDDDSTPGGGGSSTPSGGSSGGSSGGAAAGGDAAELAMLA